MKKNIRRYIFLFLIISLLGLTFCKRDLFQKISTEVMLDNIIVDPHFNYATSINTNLKIKTIDSNGKSMNNIRIDILSDYTINGGRLITSATTDINGILNINHPLPAFYKDIVIATKYPGLEGEYKVQIAKGKVELAINQNKPLTKTPIQISIDNSIDSDNDGIPDIYDDYPMDKNKSFNSFFPIQGKTGTLAFEDLWPAKGDYDFNDLVIDYNFNQILNAQQNVTEIDARFIVKATGAGFENGFGFQLNVDPLIVESVTGIKLTDNYIYVSANGLEVNQNKAVIIVFDNAFKHFRNITGNNPPYMAGYNTSVGGMYGTPDTLYVVVKFSKAISQTILGNPPYNSFIITNKRRGYEVHLPDMPPTDLANLSLLGTKDDNSDIGSNRYYKSSNNLPWAINLSQSFSYPIEKAALPKAYLLFPVWAQSNGTIYTDWFSNTSSTYRDINFIYH
ncbi:MAG: LruC domain-containing protein [Bacteroidota bacterium]